MEVGNIKETINMNTINIFSSLVTVIATVILAVVAYFTLRANKRAVEAMENQHEASIRPYIKIRLFHVPRSPVIYLGVSNIGKMSANDLRLEIEKDFYELGA